MSVRELGDVVVRGADQSDADALIETDPVAAGGSDERCASIRRWCGLGLVVMAENAAGPLGYCVVEYSFFGQGFVSMLMVAQGARRRGVGSRLLEAAVSSCTTPKLFTSTNVSNQPMQRLLRDAGWSPVGLVHGLDEGDPELFFLRRREPGPANPAV
ncbi:GNAT family N-acetyltransferase [Micromonospora sp. B11E3]|uniref:GNAT family N-acetyltransferase n=1 Tax=Micromonospora sp. B11E3 TaxID=3153562 RepID=UPI00325F6CB1